jgi:hypothetical protein
MPPSYMPKTTMSTFASHHKSGADLRFFRDDPNPYKVSDIGEYRIQVQDPFVPKSLNRSQQVLSYYSVEGDDDSPYAVGNGMTLSEGGADSSASDIVFGGGGGGGGGVRQRMFDKYESSGDSNSGVDFYPGGGGGGGGRVIQRSQTLKSNTSGSHSHKSSNSSRSHHLPNHHTGRSSRVSGSVSISSVGDAGDIETECEIPEPDYEGSTNGSSEDIPLPIPDSSCSEEYSSVSAGSDHPDHYNMAGASPSPELERAGTLLIIVKKLLLKIFQCLYF